MPIYFVVSRSARGVTGALYYDDLPTRFPDPVVYKIRIDTLPDAERWLNLGVKTLMTAYHRLAAANRLPAEPKAVSKKAAPTEVKIGYREKPRWEFPKPELPPQPLSAADLYRRDGHLDNFKPVVKTPHAPLEGFGVGTRECAD